MSKFKPRQLKSASNMDDAYDELHAKLAQVERERDKMQAWLKEAESILRQMDTSTIRMYISDDTEDRLENFLYISNKNADKE